MECLVISIAVDNCYYEKIVNERKDKKIDPAQKFFYLLGKGFSLLENCNTTFISVIPVSKSSYPQKEIMEETFESGGIRYIIPYFKNDYRRLNTQRRSVKQILNEWIKETENKDRFVIIDPLIYHVAHEARIICKREKVKCVAVVTDLPYIWNSMNKMKGPKAYFSLFYNYCSEQDIKRYKYLVLLTEPMADYLRRKAKYLVVNGVSDSTLTNEQKDKKENSSIVYAGGIYKIFKLENFIKAFINCQYNQNYNLDFYGNGDDVETIKRYAEKYSNIRYLGVVANSEIVKVEQQAKLLINPRPVRDEYTKYSFPSKIIEYMRSGTPVLTTNLPCFSKEYEDYLYYFKDDSILGMTETLDDILSLDDVSLMKKGEHASNYVASHMANSIIAKKIFLFLKGEKNETI